MPEERLDKMQSIIMDLYEKQRLYDNLMDYVRGADRMELALMKSSYWPDATDDHGGFEGNGHEWCESAFSGWKDTYYSCKHHVSNVITEIDGSYAKRESMFICVVNFKDPAVSMFQAGRYRDLCEKRDDEWKILRRTCVWDWSEQRPTQPCWDLVNVPHMSNWGAFYPNDPIYLDWWSSPKNAYPRP